MNQRIIDLADEAIEDMMPKMRWEIPDEFCEKFAWLIIQEVIYDCMNSVRGDDVTRIAMVAKNWGVDV
jgi:hypothetical protein